MTPELISLPMYHVNNQPETRTLLQTLQRLINEESSVNAQVLSRADASPEDLWRNPGTLLTQTCGYPLWMLLPDVRVVGTFHYSAEGCQGYDYSSQLVVRTEDKANTLKDFHNRRVVCNSQHSQSGFHSLQGLLSSVHRDGRFFKEVIFSGSHCESLAAIQRGEADISAIDSVTWALVQQNLPELGRGLISIGTTASMPGLPLITSEHTTAAGIKQLRQALSRLVREPEWQPVCAPLLIAGFTPTDRENYRPVYENVMAVKKSGLTIL